MSANFSGAGLEGRADKIIRVDEILTAASESYIDIESYFSSGQYQNQFQMQPVAVLIYVNAQTDFAEIDANLQMDAPTRHIPIPLSCGVWHSVAIKRIYKADTTANLRIYIAGIRVI